MGLIRANSVDPYQTAPRSSLIRVCTFAIPTTCLRHMLMVKSDYLDFRRIMSINRCPNFFFPVNWCMWGRFDLGRYFWFQKKIVSMMKLVFGTTE